MPAQGRDVEPVGENPAAAALVQQPVPPVPNAPRGRGRQRRNAVAAQDRDVEPVGENPAVAEAALPDLRVRREQHVNRIFENMRLREEMGPQPIMDVILFQDPDDDRAPSPEIIDMDSEDEDVDLALLQMQIDEENDEEMRLNPIVSEEEDLGEEEESGDEVADDDACSVCLTRRPNVGINSCNHLFCRKCLTRLGRLPPPRTCPLCREVYTEVLN